MEVIFAEQSKKAQLITSKYEILTREYQTQNKSLKENHERIIKAEETKRKEIISNFETHLAQIKSQIKEDTEKFTADGGGEMAKENQVLKTQYEALMKEIEEKSQLMDN